MTPSPSRLYFPARQTFLTLSWRTGAYFCVEQGTEQQIPVKWRKSPAKLIATFEAVAPGPPALHRKMFGYPAAFVNGNMFMGLFQEEMFLRLPEDVRRLGTGLEPLPAVVGR
jgi:hypothetical protein